MTSLVFQKYRRKFGLGSVDLTHQELCINMGRPATIITLSEAEKTELLRRVKLREGAQDARLRAEIILACAAGESGNDIAQRLGTSKDVVSRWRQRFSKLGLLGLNDEPRSGRPRTISDELVQ